MAPLNFCVRASEIRSLLAEGREREAMALLLDGLRDGTATKAMMLIAAERLASPDPNAPTRRGPKSKPLPHRFYEIGKALEKMEEEGRPVRDIVRALAKTFGRGPRTIESTISLWRAVRATGNRN